MRRSALKMLSCYSELLCRLSRESRRSHKEAPLRNYDKERAASTAAVAKAEAKVDEQAALVASMVGNDARLPDAKRALAQMRQNAALAVTNGAFLEYDEENDTSSGTAS